MELMSAAEFISQINPWLLTLLIVWSIAWKGVALWTSARSGQKAWFIALLLINTVGFLEIIYLAFFRVKKSTYYHPYLR
ncbi:MAG: DUF5652 family protein [Syntrophaceticus sp.]